MLRTDYREVKQKEGDQLGNDFSKPGKTVACTRIVAKGMVINGQMWIHFGRQRIGFAARPDVGCETKSQE